MTTTISAQTETVFREPAAREGQDVSAVADTLLADVLVAEVRHDHSLSTHVTDPELGG